VAKSKRLIFIGSGLGPSVKEMAMAYLLLGTIIIMLIEFLGLYTIKKTLELTLYCTKLIVIYDFA